MIQLSLTSSGELSADIGGHSVTVPCSLAGLIFLRGVLHAQARAPEAKIGTEAKPTQSMVEAFLATHKIAPAPAALTAAQIMAKKTRLEYLRAARAAKRPNFDFSELDLSEIDL